MKKINTKKLVYISIFKKNFLFFILFFGSFLIFFSVYGIEYGGIGIKPAYPRSENPRTESIFVHTTKPGDIIEEGVIVVNNSTEQKTLLVYAVDSTPSTGGAFACAQAADPKNSVGNWITLQQNEITLNPGSNSIIPFKISVPQNVSVGEHNGCIVAQEKKQGNTNNKGGINLSLRTGLRVAITIPGEIKRELKIVNFSIYKKDNFFILHPLIKNLGNVSIDADIKVITNYFFGLKYFEQGGQYPILRGETSDWNFELKKPFWGGWYYSKFIAEYDANPEATVGLKSGKNLTKLEGPTIWFFSFPTLTALAIEIMFLLFIIFGFLFWWLWQKRKKWITETWIDYQVQDNENIKLLAERFDVSWKLLAKVNKLKPPYAFKSGEKIKVPPK